jgi:ubiquinone/menaquinone biosynthesis C-methylase UbiE
MPRININMDENQLSEESMQQKLLSSHYDSVSSKYDEGYNNSVAHGEDRLVAEIMLPYIGSRVVDFGCGTGLFLESLVTKKLDIYLGVDISEGMLDKARAKFPDGNFLLHDMHTIPADNDSFDRRKIQFYKVFV